MCYMLIDDDYPSLSESWHISSGMSSSLSYRPLFSLLPKFRTNGMNLIFPKGLSCKRLALVLLLSGDIAQNPGPENTCKIGLSNARSIRHKGPHIEDLILYHKFDIFAVTETWLSSQETQSFLASLSPDGYKLFHTPVPVVAVVAFAFSFVVTSNVVPYNFLSLAILKAMVCQLILVETKPIS